MLKNIKLTVKLPIFIVMLVFIATSVVGYLSYVKAEEILNSNIKNTLSSLTEARAHEVSSHFDSIDKDIKFQSENRFIQDATVNFIQAWNLIEGNKKAYLQDMYIHKNPNPLGEKHQLDRAADITLYNQVHV